MDLIYAYIGSVGRTVGEFGVNLSRDFEVTFTPGKQAVREEQAVYEKLTIRDLRANPNAGSGKTGSIYGENILAVDLIVGKNGVGKTTLMDLLGMGEKGRLHVFPQFAYTHDPDWVTVGANMGWFALYHIEGNEFAIEGNRYGIDFHKGMGLPLHDNIRLARFRYNFKNGSLEDIWFPRPHSAIYNTADETNNIWKELFFLYYRNSVNIPWIKSGDYNDHRYAGADGILGRIPCKRTGYTAITNFLLLLVSHKNPVLRDRLKINLGTAIKIRIETDRLSDDEAGYFIYGIKNNVDEEPSFEKYILNYSYDPFGMKKRLNCKQGFIITCLEQMVLILRKNKNAPPDSATNGFSSYREHKKYLIGRVKDLEESLEEKPEIYFGQDTKEELSIKHNLLLEIVEGLEAIAEKYFNKTPPLYIRQIEIKIPVRGMRKNCLNRLMNALDKSQRKDYKTCLQVEFDGISTGEAQMIDIFAMLHNSIPRRDSRPYHREGATCVLLLDEPDLGFHPEWSRQFVELLTELLRSEAFRHYRYHVIISTHSPIMLSDIPCNCIHMIAGNKREGKQMGKGRQYGLSSNINDILKGKFFVESLLGSFAQKYVDALLRDISKIEKELDKTGPLDTPEAEKRHSECIRSLDDAAERSAILGDGYIKNYINNRIVRDRQRLEQGRRRDD